MDFFILMLAIPLVSGALLTVVGERDWAPNINVLASLGTFSGSGRADRRDRCQRPALCLWRAVLHRFAERLLRHLTAFVGLTTSIFSGPYMRNERDRGRLSKPRLRLYKSMYQLFMFTMLAALTTNNLGILWVAMEAATLTTVLLVSLYRTPASLEAAWKYFILCGVGIAQALFGTVLLYFAAERVLGAAGNALLWTHLVEVKAQLEPAIMALSFIFLLVGYGTKVGLRRCTTGCPTPMPKARRQSRQCFPACC
jgi:hydrogenase-4 component F